VDSLVDKPPHLVNRALRGHDVVTRRHTKCTLLSLQAMAGEPLTGWTRKK
jgi:hypothetical protein